MRNGMQIEVSVFIGLALSIASGIVLAHFVIRWLS